eukprot:CAMPEP_0175075490 /NCGR_PEP_ID=MMETSP0052_2-20121109/22040_1 /TAXON_ID=51329 ORGANISM="Polytomella parva, Strain SAG 63-3" /NCGR_SAMPLE_ID=MMETSP0052_2 /ASSEMBLY_ACC=CAM_ASM_000194 /LENGTH=57 /DNA_ID=CAMNT_0016344203 /DNA_START=157 /DNA_END=330 /DNA_ORIENTATION=-
MDHQKKRVSDDRGPRKGDDTWKMGEDGNERIQVADASGYGGDRDGDGVVVVDGGDGD